MALLCYNKGCGLNFDADKNKDGKILPVSFCICAFNLNKCSLDLMVGY